MVHEYTIAAKKRTKISMKERNGSPTKLEGRSFNSSVSALNNTIQFLFEIQ